jgi:hypothetical protein
MEFYLVAMNVLYIEGKRGTSRQPEISYLHTEQNVISRLPNKSADIFNKKC